MHSPREISRYREVSRTYRCYLAFPWREISKNVTSNAPRTINCGRHSPLIDDASLCGKRSSRPDLVSNRIEYMLFPSFLLGTRINQPALFLLDPPLEGCPESMRDYDRSSAEGTFIFPRLAIIIDTVDYSGKRLSYGARTRKIDHSEPRGEENGAGRLGQ